MGDSKSRKSKTDSNSAQVKRNIQKEFERRKAAERQAHKIVEQLLEVDISQETFLSSLKLLAKEHYNDVVEERSISGLCGYALCPNEVKQVPKQQYKINRNKVYDITERKKYCCDKCYSLSEFVCDQISPVPLWMRDTARIPDVKLENLSKAEQLPGEEIQLRKVVSVKEVQRLTKDEQGEEIRESAATNTASKVNKNLAHQKDSSNRRLEDIVDDALKTLRDWLTDSSLAYLGVLPKEKEQVEATDTIVVDNKQHTLEQQLDRLLLGTKTTSEAPSKPIPNYKTLHTDLESYEEKVEEFFGGAVQIRETKKPNEKKISELEDNTKDAELVIPTVDSKNQMNIRRRIVQERIVKSILSLSLPLGPSTSYIVQECRKMVNTLKFTNTNVMLRADEWVIMAVVTLHILSMVNSDIEEAMKSDNVALILDSILKAYNMNSSTLSEKIKKTIHARQCNEDT